MQIFDTRSLWLRLISPPSPYEIHDREQLIMHHYSLRVVICKQDYRAPRSRCNYDVHVATNYYYLTLDARRGIKSSHTWSNDLPLLSSLG